MCVVPIEPEEGYGWLNGHHTQHRWKRQRVRLVEWGQTHRWQKEVVCNLISVIHVCDPNSASRTIFSVFVCLLINQRRSMEDWMGTTQSMDEKDEGYGWLNGGTHMDERGKVCLSLSHTCVRPLLSQLYHSLCHSILCVCVSVIQQEEG